jgi:hypothetical protein
MQAIYYFKVNSFNNILSNRRLCHQLIWKIFLTRLHIILFKMSKISLYRQINNAKTKMPMFEKKILPNTKLI